MMSEKKLKPEDREFWKRVYVASFAVCVDGDTDSYMCGLADEAVREFRERIEDDIISEKEWVTMICSDNGNLYKIPISRFSNDPDCKVSPNYYMIDNRIYKPDTENDAGLINSYIKQQIQQENKSKKRRK